MGKLPEALLTELANALNAAAVEVTAAKKGGDIEKLTATLEKVEDLIDQTLDTLEEDQGDVPFAGWSST